MTVSSEPSAILDRIADPGFTPGRRDLPRLLAHLGDREHGDAVLRALVRAGEVAATAAFAAFDAADAGARPRICELVGRFARDPARVAWLGERLHDGDERVRRRAATALGKLEDPTHEQALLDAWQRATSDTERKAIAAALGQCGGNEALAMLDAVQTTDPELLRVLGTTRHKLTRGIVRSEATTIDLDAVAEEPFPIDLHVRIGLEPWILSKLAGAHVVERGRVRVVWHGSLRELFAVRTFVAPSFPLAPQRVRSSSPEAIEGAIVRAITSEPALAIFTTWTRGPVRWRLDWTGRGHQRAAVWRIGQTVGLLRPELVNDSRDAPWQVTVTTRRDVVAVSLVPRGLVDPRFVWRRGTVPASSHPTIAAALAEAAEVRPGDVVWDPFVGAGAELVECALASGNPSLALLGTDLEADAITTARSNLDAAGLHHATLAVADACTWLPPRPPSLIISNPPMGHRVRGDAPIPTLLSRALDHWATVVAPGARIVWLSPAPEQTASHPAVRVRQRMPVDIGGLMTELQDLAFVGPVRRK